MVWYSECKHWELGHFRKRYWLKVNFKMISFLCIDCERVSRCFHIFYLEGKRCPDLSSQTRPPLYPLLYLSPSSPRSFHPIRALRWTRQVELSLRVPVHARSLSGPRGPPGSSLWSFQARAVELLATSYSRGPSWVGDRACVSCAGRQTLHHRATWEGLSPRRHFRRQPQDPQGWRRQIGGIFLQHRSVLTFFVCFL